MKHSVFFLIVSLLFVSCKTNNDFKLPDGYKVNEGSMFELASETLSPELKLRIAIVDINGVSNNVKCNFKFGDGKNIIKTLVVGDSFFVVDDYRNIGVEVTVIYLETKEEKPFAIFKIDIENQQAVAVPD